MDFLDKTCWSKTEKVNTTVEWCVYELVKVPNFSLNWQFWVFGPNLPTKGVLSRKQKNWTSSMNSVYSIYSWYQTSGETDNFDDLDQTCPKNKFSVENRKQKNWTLAIEFCIFELVLVLNISLKWQFWVFGTKFAQIGYFQSKAEKVSITIEFCAAESV